MLWKLVFAAVVIVGIVDHVKAGRNEYFDLNAEAFCDANSTKYNIVDVQASISTFSTCMDGLVDIDTVKQEIQEVSTTKDYGKVFKKYCAKAAEIKSCILTLITGLSPCLPADVAGNAKKVYNSAIDYVCYNEGDRLTSFFKEDGPKCIEEKKTAFRGCDEGASAARVSSVLQVTEAERCTLGGQFTACAVAAMKTCANPIPGKLAEELRYVYFSSINCPGIKQEVPAGLKSQ